MRVEELKKLSFPEIKDMYRNYLINRGFGDNTIQTSCSDSFYLLRHDVSLDFWEMVKSSDWEKVSYEHLKNILSKKSKGNVERNVNGYMFHMRTLRQFVSEDIETVTSVQVFRESKPRVVTKRNVSKRDDVPTPTVAEVEKYLGSWDNLENYHLQEDALNKLFFQFCPKNTDISDILLKVSTLNDFYSTNIYWVFNVAQHIHNLNIDERLITGDVTLVNEIKCNNINGEIRNLYSFASKYCSHHNPNDYPIYDSYVDKVLRYFRDVDGFCSFKNKDLTDYEKFKDILIQFRAYYNLDDFSLKEIDKYIWQMGKEYFPNNYGKKK